MDLNIDASFMRGNACMYEVHTCVGTVVSQTTRAETHFFVFIFVQYILWYSAVERRAHVKWVPN